MTVCPICAAASPAPFLVRDPVPVHQNLLAPTAEAAVALRRGRVALHACGACGFVFNAAFDPSLLSYGAAYDNTQSCSPAFSDYVEALADRMVGEGGVRGCRIVEIGCGKGNFLRALIRRDPSNRGTGFDPSYVGPDSEFDGRLRFARRFFDASSAGLEADVIVCRHVIEHVQDPVAMLQLMRRTAGHRPVRLFLETPCVEWILANEVTWDFFYEHCSYFSTGSLETALAAAGFAAEVIRHTFGGQYLWAEARAGEGALPASARQTTIPALARRFAAHEASRVDALRRRVEALAADGPVAMWGAGAKGVTLANLIDPERRSIACVLDLNPNKQGGYLPGTGHPIVGPADLPRWNVHTAVLTNPNYVHENTQLLREASIDVRLIDLMLPGQVDAHSR